MRYHVRYENFFGSAPGYDHIIFHQRYCAGHDRIGNVRKNSGLDRRPCSRQFDHHAVGQQHWHRYTAPTSPLTILSGAASPAVSARDTGSGPAVWGIANSGFGLRGNSASGPGVGGYSTSYVGLLGNSTNNIGIWGIHAAGTGTQPGVRGQTASTDPNSSGVAGFAGSGIGVYGQSTNSNGLEGLGGANGVKGASRSRMATASSAKPISVRPPMRYMEAAAVALVWSDQPRAQAMA